MSWELVMVWQSMSTLKQESPPAWTQEAYRPPRSHSKSLLLRWGGGGSLDKIFFSGLNMYQAKSGVKKVFPLLGPPLPPDLRLGTPPGPETGYPPWTWDQVPTPTWTWTWDPPCGQTHRQVSKHYLPIVLRTRAVITQKQTFYISHSIIIIYVTLHLYLKVQLHGPVYNVQILKQNMIP